MATIKSKTTCIVEGCDQPISFSYANAAQFGHRQARKCAAHHDADKELAKLDPFTAEVRRRRLLADG